MAITTVQVGDSGASVITTGVAWNLPSNVGVGSTVVMAVRTVGVGTPPTAVSGLGATWTQICAAERGGAAANVSWWVGPGCTGGSSAITVTIVSHTYVAVAWEMTGTAAASSGGTNSPTTGTTDSLTVSGIVAGDWVGVAVLSPGATSAHPSSPWSVYNTGSQWLESNSQDVAFQVATGSSNQTASWTAATGAWGLAGIIVTASAASAFGGTFMPLIAGA